MAAVASPPPSSSSSSTKYEAIQTAQSYLNARLNSSTSTSAPSFRTIPIIDLAPSFSPNLSDRKSVAKQIHDACSTVGFFYITNHNIPAKDCEDMLTLAERFFKELPREKKEAIHLKHSGLFRGWEPSEYTKVNPEHWKKGEEVTESKEGFNWGYEEGLDPTGGDGKYVELDGTRSEGNVWPSEEDLPGFYGGIRAYYGQCLALARHLFRLFALSLNLPETHFDPLCTHPGGIGRLLYYPPSANPSPDPLAAPPPAQNETEIGLGAHTDYECFTILLQSPSPGLEILSPDGHWIVAAPVPNSLIINIADFMMRWTNGVYKSTVHRVVNRTDQERFSVPFFFSVNYDETVSTLPGCVREGEEGKYRPIRAGEYILERLKATVEDGY